MVDIMASNFWKGRYNLMNIYVGIDIAKHNHFAAAISFNTEIIIEPFNFSSQQKNPGTFVPGFLAERWGFEPQNAFDTLHDFQSCALDQLSHLSTSSVFTASGRGPQRSTIIPERRSFVKHFFKKVCIFSKMTQLRLLKMKRRRRTP